MFCLLQLTNGLMKVYFMKILLKIYITHLLIIKNLRGIIINIIKNLEFILVKITILKDAPGSIYYAWKKKW